MNDDDTQGSVPQSPKAPAGWYAGPEHPDYERWQDDSQWTDKEADSAAALTEHDAGAAQVRQDSQAPQVDTHTTMHFDLQNQAVSQPDAIAQQEYPNRPNTTSQSPIKASTENLPAIENWKTSVGFSILGLFAGFALWIMLSIILCLVLALILGDALSVFDTSIFGLNLGEAMGLFVGPLAGATLYLFTAIYALAIYPTYFKVKPLVTSNKAVSFLNLMFGGMIFGMLWNRNLTKSHRTDKKKKGASYIVAGILNGTALSLALVISIGVVAPQIMDIENYYQITQNYPSSTYENEELGVSFTIPAGWQIDESTVSEGSAEFRFPGDNVTRMSYMAIDTWAELSDDSREHVSRDEAGTDILNPEFYVDWLSDALNGSSDISVHKVNLGNNTFYMIKGTGLMNVSKDRVMPAKGMMFFGMKDGIEVNFRCLVPSRLFPFVGGAYFDDFTEMVASVQWQ